MNERILELAEQATKKISFRLDPNTYKHIDDPEGDLERFEFDKQKFAELIVRECVDIVSGTAVNTPPNDLFYGYNLGVNKAAENIKERFGIEE